MFRLTCVRLARNADTTEKISKKAAHNEQTTFRRIGLLLCAALVTL